MRIFMLGRDAEADHWPEIRPETDFVTHRLTPLDILQALRKSFLLPEGVVVDDADQFLTDERLELYARRLYNETDACDTVAMLRANQLCAWCAWWGENRPLAPNAAEYTNVTRTVAEAGVILHRIFSSRPDTNLFETGRQWVAEEGS